MENSASEGLENLPVQTEPIDLSKASSENIVTFTQTPVYNASNIGFWLFYNSSSVGVQWYYGPFPNTIYFHKCL